jgi:membrane protease YdiL (CAAX protease family)
MSGMTEEISSPGGPNLRPIWRFALSFCLVLFAYLTVNLILGAVFHFAGSIPNLFAILFAANLSMLAALLGIYKMLCLLVEDKPLAFAGLGFHGRWKNELGFGLALGALMILAVAAMERTCGAADFSPASMADGGAQQVASWAAYSVIIFSVAGTSEELGFRGYPFQRLADSIGPIGATAAFAILFGLVHLGNSSHTWISTCNTMLVGVTFAVAYLRTRALWLPIGIHVAWNIVQGFVLGFPVSGIVLPQSLLRPQVRGPVWLTGGDYGPEGGLFTTLIFVAATVYLLLSKRIYVSREMRNLVFGPAEAATQAAAPAAHDVVEENKS